MTAPVGWGFLGAGYIARAALAPAVHSADGAALVAAGARDIARAAALGPRGAAYGSYDEVLADPSVEAVYIALANDDHLPWAERALAAGKHVLCEKPLGLTAAEVRQMAATARAADRLLVEASWNRWHPRTRRAEALLRSGAIGAVRRVEAGFTFAGVAEDNYRLDPARGGGALYDVGCYATAAALWATGFTAAPGGRRQPPPLAHRSRPHDRGGALVRLGRGLRALLDRRGRRAVDERRGRPRHARPRRQVRLHVVAVAQHAHRDDGGRGPGRALRARRPVPAHGRARERAPSAACRARGCSRSRSRCGSPRPST